MEAGVILHHYTKIIGWAVLVMEGLLYGELFEKAADSFVVAEVVRRNQGSGRAERYAIIRRCQSKQEADLVLGFFEGIGVDACMVPTFADSDAGVKAVIVGGAVKEAGKLVTPEDHARFFRSYYNFYGKKT